jgi:rhodanese-related sulfurtransferase
VIFGVGEMDIARDASLSPRSPPPQPPPPPTNPPPYLLLDVRNKDDYDQCHIITGKSLQLSYAMLSIFISYISFM